MKRFIGVDLHRKSFTVCIREEGKESIEEWKVKNVELFAKMLSKEDWLAVEATGNTAFFVKEIEKQSGKIVVVNPYQFKVISNSAKKTDENDAKILALFLEKDMLPEVRIKRDEQAKLSSVAHTRDKLVKLRTVLKNKVNNIFARNALVLSKEFLSSEKGLKEVEKADFDTVTNREIKVVVDQIRSLNRSITELEEVMIESSKTMDGHKNLTSIKGIGDKGAAVMLSAIGNINDFSDSGKLASYFGIVPRVQNSGETVSHGRITKKGNKLARTTLVQCSLIAKRYSPYLDAYYQRIKSRRGTPKAIIALARKFLDIIYKTLKNNWVFEDFTTFKLLES